MPRKKKSQGGNAGLWILAFVFACFVVWIATYDLPSTTPQPQAQDSASEEQEQPMSVSQPEQVLEDQIDLFSIVACEESPEYTPIGSEEMGILYDLPDRWHWDYYLPNERIGSGGGPEYFAAMSNVPDNFDPAYSRGTGQYGNIPVVQVLLYRDPKEPLGSIYDSVGVSPNDPNVQVLEGADPPGFLYTEESPGNSSWITIKAVYDFDNYVVIGRGTFWGNGTFDQTFDYCFDTMMRILLSISPLWQ